MTRNIATVLVFSLTFAACDSQSRVTNDPEHENQGVFYFGDEASARVQQKLVQSTRIREILHGPQGAGFATGRGMTLEQAKASVEESIAYYERALFQMSPAGAVARLETQLRSAEENLAMLRGPSGPDIAAERGMTLEQALAELERRIRLYDRHIEHRRAAADGLNNIALDNDDCSDPVNLVHMTPGLELPHYDPNLNATHAYMSASHLSENDARQEIWLLAVPNG